MLALWLVSSLALALQCPQGTQAQKSSDGLQEWCATPDGTKQGPFESRHSNGRIRSQATYLDGQADGNYARYNEEGRVVERGRHRSGKMEGKWEHFDDDGALKDQTLWKDGVPNGPFEFFYPNGKKKVSGRYTDGELSGRWSQWDVQGKVTSTGEYQCGNRVGTWTLTENQTQRQETFSSLGCGSGSEWRLFRGEGMVAIDQGELALSTAAVSWVPRVAISSWFGLRPRLGATVVKLQGTGAVAPVALGDLWLEFRFLSRWSLGLGGGTQYVFTSSSGFSFGASGFVSFEPRWRSLRFLRAITFSEIVVFAQPSTFLMLALGADISF